MVRRRRFATGAAALVAALAFPTDATLAGRRSRGSGALAASHARCGLRTRRKRFGRAPRPPLLRHGRPRAITVRNELKSNRARIAPIAPNAEQHTKPQENKGNQTPKRKVSPQTTLQTTLQTNQQTTLQTTPQTIMGDSPGDLSKMELEIVLAIRSNPEITRTAIASNLGITLDGVKYHLKALRIKLGLRHEGPTKKGRWVFGPKP